MGQTVIRHASLVFERLIPAPVGRVYQAYADVKLRSAWGAPTDTAVLIYDEENFRVGGADRYRCGNKSNPNIHGTTIYLEIVPEERIVQVETIDMDGRRLAASLVTLELKPSGVHTYLKNTVQVTSLIGDDMIKGHEQGHNGSLDSLIRFFQAQG